MSDRILNSIERTAERLDISPWTVRAWIRQGKIQSIKRGTRRLIPESELLRFATGAEIADSVKETSA